MLYPRVQMISVKGQVVLPADARTALGMTPGKAVTVIPDLARKQVVIVPLGRENPVERGYGLLAGKVPSLTRLLMKEKIREAAFEKKKYGIVRSG